MDNKQELIKIADKIRRVCGGYYAQVWIDNGVFIIHDVKQEDYNYILGNLNRIKEVSNISCTSRYDFNKPFFGVAPKIYTIRGNFSLSVNESFTLIEMAMSRKDAIDRCMGLGQEFIEHFGKVYDENDKDVTSHWINEMQKWYNQIRKIKMKPKSESIPFNNLMDWFFTVGSEPEEYLGDDTNKCSKYNDFAIDLYKSGDVRKSLISVGVIKE